MDEKRTYTVKEFDYLVSSTGARFLSSSVSSFTILPDAIFDELIEYLLSSVKEEGKQLFRVMKLSSNAHFGKAIQLQNYVGIIELPRSKKRIEILPKIYSGNAEVGSIREIKQILLSMLSSLKDFPLLHLGEASLDLKKLSLYEVFIRIFLDRVLDLSKRGLKSDYLEVTENSSSFRGHLNVPLHIKYNSAHDERFYIIHEEYSLSRPENRILKSAILKLLKVTEDAENAFLAKRALIYFDEVAQSLDFESDYRRIQFDSSNQGYLGVIQWAMVFLRNQSFSIFGGGTNGQSLLFPMDRIFEQYIASQIARLIRLHNKKYGTHYRFVSQESNKYLFDVPKSFKIRPDLKLDQEGCETILLDTKWKILSDKKPKNNISQSDMYQMYAYSKRYHATDVYLLYPAAPSTPFIQNREFLANDPMLTTRIRLEFLDVPNIVTTSKKGLNSSPNCLYQFLLQFIKTDEDKRKTIVTV